MIQEITTTGSRGFLAFNISPEHLEKFDDSETIRYYAREFQREQHEHYSLDEYADVVAGILKDDSAGIRFKREVRRMRHQRLDE